MEAVRIKGGTSLRNNMWHYLRKEININEVKITSFFHGNFATPAVFLCCGLDQDNNNNNNNRIVDYEIKDKNSD